MSDDVDTKSFAKKLHPMEYNGMQLFSHGLNK